MNTTEAINWQTFKSALVQHPGLCLQFEYAPGRFVDAGYHITEIKQANITSVDCGGVMNAWAEVIVQLWVPGNSVQKLPMKVSKALSIVNTVEKMLPLNGDGIVKVEFGNSEFEARQMFPNGITTHGGNITVSLRADAVQCKAIGRNESCGTEKPKLQMANLSTAAAACCTPGGGCC